MSGSRPERIDHECPVTSIICCAQQTVKLGMIGDWSPGGYDPNPDVRDMLRLTLQIIDPDATCVPGSLWLSRDDALHLSDVLRTYAIVLERTQLQCNAVEASPREKEAARA